MPTVHAGPGVGVKKYLSPGRRFTVFLAGCVALAIAYSALALFNTEYDGIIAGIFGITGLGAIVNAVRGVETF